jgi:hypothetical protein
MSKSKDQFILMREIEVQFEAEIREQEQTIYIKNLTKLTK